LALCIINSSSDHGCSRYNIPAGILPYKL
jgi:hypothetical protein